LPGERLSGYTKIAQDLTERKQLEAAHELLLMQERAVRAQAEAAVRLKDEFLAVMSHELKQPLNLVQVNAELLTRLPDVRGIPGVTRAAGVIRRAVQSQAKLIDDLLDLSRIQSGKLTLERAPGSLTSVLLPLANAAKQSARIKGLALEFSDDGQDLRASFDVVRIEQIAWNLLNNAIKFTDAGRIDVRLQRDGCFASLAVTDTGRGIAPEFLGNVFDMFRQEEATRTRHEGGMGIGLALVRELTVAHGGRVSAESAGLGCGATFSIWLPLLETFEAPTESAVGNASGSEGLRGLRLLVVDDSADTLEVFGQILEAEGASVRTALSGKAALDLLGSHDFDLLLSDIGMPDMDGYALLGEVRKRPEWAKLPAVAITGYGRHEVDHAVQRGFDAFLAKPVSLDDLKKVIESLRETARTSGTT
jgi:two-component system, chemotaxis family, CheB/CheR fusion protein